jgi:hypothetical protein
MKRLYVIILVFIFCLPACKKEDNKVQATGLPAGTHMVKVLDNMDASNYTYLKVSENGNEYWIAAPKMKVDKGEILYYTQAMEMKDFHSDALNRTFPSIYFVQSITGNPQMQSLSTVHQQVSATPREQISIEPLKDGKTIAQIFSQRNELSGRTVRLRGKVVKYNPNIMDRNWVHIQDGTESDGNYDLLITSKDVTSLGQIIVVEGKVALNKDFGAGYSYTVLLEDAKISSEKPI